MVAEGSALDEDEQADGRRHHGEQDVAPTDEGLGDDGSGGEEPARQAPHGHGDSGRGAPGPPFERTLRDP